MRKPKKQDFKLLIFSIILTNGVGILSSVATLDAIPNWYLLQNLPPLTPPNWVFGPVWTLLYTLMGITLFNILGAPKSKVRTYQLKLFGIQLFLNFMWSIFFFGFKWIEVAFIDIILLDAVVFMLIMSLKKTQKTAALLLVPYLIWITFASYLNLWFMFLN